MIGFKARQGQLEYYKEYSMPSGNGNSGSKAKKKTSAAKPPAKSSGSPQPKNFLQQVGDTVKKDIKGAGQAANNVRGALSAQYRFGHKKDSKGNWS